MNSRRHFKIVIADADGTETMSPMKAWLRKKSSSR
jgi:hypothetical protein